MMKNFTKIILGLFTLATSFTANAAMEWREVSKVDFGGNSTEDPAILKTEPRNINTGLKWYEWNKNYETDHYMIIKATQLADVGRGLNLTNWGTAVMGAPTWAEGGDHTNPDSPEEGYFMAFDCPFKSEVKLLQQALDVSCTGVKFKLQAYFAVLNYTDLASNDVSVAIEAGGVEQASATLTSSTNSEWASPTKQIKWIPLSVEFTLNDPSINSVDFYVRALNCEGPGWDFGLDDITISVEQPAITIPEKKFEYKKEAIIEAQYEKTEFDAFFSGASNVKYQWFKLNPNTNLYETISGAGGSYTSGTNINCTIPSFDVKRDTGWYRVVVAPDGAIGDGNNQNLCAIQKDHHVIQSVNEQTVYICKGETRVVEGITITPSATLNPETQPAVELPSDPGNYIQFNVFRFDPNQYGEPAPIITYDCAKNGLTPGEHPGSDIITYKTFEDGYQCPETITKTKTIVSDVIKDSVDICKGQTYPATSGDKYDNVDETVGTKIAFIEDGCTHERWVFVHPTYEIAVDEIVCEGSSYSTAKKTLTSIYGCDSIVTPNIKIVKPKKDTIYETHCPSDNFTYKGVVYDHTTKQTFQEHYTSAEGCDSTVYIMLEVLDGGVIDAGDTLICRDMIVFGKTWEQPGDFDHHLIGYTESGCKIDTLWHVKVAEISLKLRMFNGQTEVCEKQPLQMHAKVNSYDLNGVELGEPEHHWEPEIDDNKLDPTVYLSETTTYTIYADLNNLPAAMDPNAKGCHAKESVTIKVNPIPVLTVDTINPDDRSVEYTVTGGTTPYHMYLGAKDLGINESSEGKNDHLPYGKHILQVQDSTGCSAEQEVMIEAVKLEPDVFFTPNDDGVNDIWTIKNIDVYPTATIKVFDRYGKLLHSGVGSNFEAGWDGTYNGNKMPATDYWYEIDIDEIDTQYYGHFTLMR